MKKNILLSVIILVFFSLFISGCGVLLDSVRLEGEWQLSGAEFYAYNSDIDTNYVYKGLNKRNPSDTQPIIASFFGVTQLPKDGEHKFIIDFNRDKTLRIYDTNDDTNKDVPGKYTDGIVRSNKGKWAIDNYENTLNIRIYDDDVSDDNLLGKDSFWRNGGFVIKNYWPMTSYTTLEITVKSEDIEKQIYIYLNDNKKVKIHTMKGIFTRPED